MRGGERERGEGEEMREGEREFVMVLILGGNSEHVVQMCRKTGNFLKINFQIYGSETGQFTDFSQHVSTSFCVTI